MFVIENLSELAVYHGGPQLIATISEITTPFFVTPSIEMATSYAVDRSHDAGTVTQFAFSPQHLATSEDIKRACSVNRLLDDFFDSPDHEFLSPNIRAESKLIITTLTQQGFDAVSISDYGMDCPFTTYDTYVVLDTSCLSNPRAI